MLQIHKTDESYWIAKGYEIGVCIICKQASLPQSTICLKCQIIKRKAVKPLRTMKKKEQRSGKWKTSPNQSGLDLSYWAKLGYKPGVCIGCGQVSLPHSVSCLSCRKPVQSIKESRFKNPVQRKKKHQSQTVVYNHKQTSPALDC